MKRWRKWLRDGLGLILLAILADDAVELFGEIRHYLETPTRSQPFVFWLSSAVAVTGLLLLIGVRLFMRSAHAPARRSGRRFRSPAEEMRDSMRSGDWLRGPSRDRLLVTGLGGAYMAVGLIGLAFAVGAPPLHLISAVFIIYAVADTSYRFLRGFAGRDEGT